MTHFIHRAQTVTKIRIDLIEHVDTAISKLADFTIKKSTDLEDEARFILGIVKQNSGKKIGDLFKLYEGQGGKMSAAQAILAGAKRMEGQQQ
jgi:hypothetical protein